MTVGWPGLGFDPAPGDAVAAAVAARGLDVVAADLDGTATALRVTARPDDGWTGGAATAFAAHAGALPGAVAGERDVVARAGTALGGWGRDLDGFQARARDLEARAGAAREAGDGPGLDAVLAAARVLAGEHANAATAVAGVLAADLLAADVHGTAGRGAVAPAQPSPSWLGEHLDDIGDVAATISGVTGALAFVPVLTPVMAPVALASGAVALAADVADATVHDRWEDPVALAEVGTDAAALVPGVRFATGAARAAGEAVQVFRSADGLAPAAGAGWATFARGEAAAAAAYREPGTWAVAKGKALAAKTGLDADLAARGFEVQGRLARAATRAGLSGHDGGSPAP